MSQKEFLESITDLAEEAEEVGYNNFATVLYTYLGAEESGSVNKFALHCKDWSKKEVKRLRKLKKEDINNRRN